MDELDEMEDFLLNLKNSVFCVKNEIKKKLHTHVVLRMLPRYRKLFCSARLLKLPSRLTHLCILGLCAFFIVYQESNVKKKNL